MKSVRSPYSPRQLGLGCVGPIDSSQGESRRPHTALSGWLLASTGRDSRFVSHQIAVRVENPRCKECCTSLRLRKPRSRSHTKEVSKCSQAVRLDCTGHAKNALLTEDVRSSTDTALPLRTTWAQQTAEGPH